MSDLCGCKSRCGDDGDTDGPGTCKGLPMPAPSPLVQVVLIPRRAPKEETVPEPRYQRRARRLREIREERDTALGRVADLERIEKAARKLDEALSEEYSRFDSDGIYERYFRYRGEEELAALLRKGDR